MLKDIQDSTRVNTIIRHKQSLGTIDDVATSPPKPAFLRMFNQAQAHLNPPTSNSIPDKSTENESLSTSLHAKILSRLFWPSLNDERYKVPPSIASLQRKYEQGFEELKSARKLTWLPALGQATVELELRDRTVVEEVHTWQAAVIYAFDDGGSEEPISRTVDQLVEQLEMDEELVSSALRFWTHKLVLHESAQGTYIVLETLNTADRERSNAQTSSSAPHSGNGSEDSGMGGRKGKGKGEGGMDKDSDKMGIYWSFVQGMLTNSSKEMQVGQIGMMLKMLIVEGFPFSNEELGEWLGGKAQEGLLEVNGGKYRLKR
jgi:anaphase-promoting complex subunit 2